VSINYKSEDIKGIMMDGELVKIQPSREMVQERVLRVLGVCNKLETIFTTFGTIISKKTLHLVLIYLL
jgi:hypothetical protein